ncbi:hypothetical protein IWZ03DRAFT_417692 [Phyllosticta citriasiana]|uniref:CHAT domain-containing protein n=1 Tax=Phyllosticta citriasiana TaxID=595635 RepID=A0ABR1KCX2_9PEZI
MSDPVNLDESHILLHKRVIPDKPTVGNILDNTAPDGSENWLVYLSACSTAQVKADKMGDENLHLASTFQVTEFCSRYRFPVVGGRRHLRRDCMSLFHQGLSKYSGDERKLAVAHALREAVIQIRSQHCNSPALWAPSIHFRA